MPRARDAGFRPDIEGLRAVAVVLVLLYHAKLGPFTGGYTGVDVFYVLSGFLITSLLVRELERTGTVRLRNFWARRARRLLPASCLVIVVTLVAGHFLLTPLAQTDLAHDALASATFVVNIVFAHRQTDYLTAQLAPSPLLNFWSLALEEQFYLIWPVLIVLVAAGRRHVRAVVGGLVAVLWPISLVACIYLTTHSQPWAFYSLPTRAWELLTGAALALGATRILRLPGALRAVVGWAGLGAVLVVGVVFSDTTKFPGVAAMVPVLATAAIVAAGSSLRTGPAAVLGWGPLQWIGRRSYAIYLWHWPAIVLIDARWGPLQPWQRGLVVLGSVGVSALSFWALEDRVRHSPWLAARSWRGLSLGAALIAVGVLASAITINAVPGLTGTGEVAAATVVVPTTAAEPPTTAAGVTTPGTARPGTARTTTPATTTLPPQPADVALAATSALAAANAAQLTQSVLTTKVPSNLRPSLGKATGDLPKIYSNGCHLDAAVTKPPPCVFGDPAGTTTVALFGDSHAAQWFPALDDVAQRHHWRLLVLTKKGCPTADINVFSPMVNRQLTECGPWRENVAARLAAEHPALIVMSSYRYRQTGASAGIEPNQAWRDGLTATMDKLRPLAPQVLILGDTPTPAQNVPSCVSGHLSSVNACNNTRADAVRTDRIAVEQEVATAHDAVYVPTADWLCAADACPVVIGDVLVYRDDNHMTATAATWLAPYVEAAMVPLVEAPAPPPAPQPTATTVKR